MSYWVERLQGIENRDSNFVWFSVKRLRPRLWVVTILVDDDPDHPEPYFTPWLNTTGRHGRGAHFEQFHTARAAALAAQEHIAGKALCRLDAYAKSFLSKNTEES